MDKTAAIQIIRQKLTEGDIEAALQLLIEELEPQRKTRRDLASRALQAKARLEKAQQKELDGVASSEENQLIYNRISRQVINLVDEWEDPTVRPSASRLSGKISPKMILVAGVLLAFIGIIIWQMTGRKDPTADGAFHATDTCPELQAGTFKIAVLPFNSLRDANAPSPHRPLATRLDRFKKDYSGDFNTEVFSKDSPEPRNDDQAISLAEECRANLAIWGEFDFLQEAQGKTIINTNYRYLDIGDNFQFKMLNLNDDSEVVSDPTSSSIPTSGLFVDTVQNYLEIINRPTLTEELENQLRLLFGVALMQSGNNLPKAVEILGEVQPKDSASVLLKEMALAEGYVQKGDQQGAIAAYDRVLQTHPDYWFAVNNRAMIYYDKGEYGETLAALDKQLEKDPENITALTVRGSVLLKTMQLREAETDLLKARKLSEEQADVSEEKKQTIRQKIDLLETKKVQERRRINRADNILATDRSNLQALTEKAEAKRNLGDYQGAKNDAERVLRLDENNLKAKAVLLESADKTQNIREVNRWTNDIQQLDTGSQKTILEERPVLNRILNLRVQ